MTEKVTLDLHVSQLSEEIKRLLKHNIHLQQQLQPPQRGAQGGDGGGGGGGDTTSPLSMEVAALRKELGEAEAALQQEKEVLQQAQMLVQEVKRGRATAEESLAELREAEEHWMLAVTEAEDRAEKEKESAEEESRKVARLVEQIEELKMAEDGFYATIQDLNTELDTLRATAAVAPFAC